MTVLLVDRGQTLGSLHDLEHQGREVLERENVLRSMANMGVPLRSGSSYMYKLVLHVSVLTGPSKAFLSVVSS